MFSGKICPKNVIPTEQVTAVTVSSHDGDGSINRDSDEPKYV
jgi:hypothetical protein